MQTFEKMVEKRDFINNCMVLVHGIEFGIGTHFNRAMEEDVVALSAHVERKALSSAQQVQMPSSRPVTQATSCAKDKPDIMHLARTAQLLSRQSTRPRGPGVADRTRRSAGPGDPAGL